MALESNIENIFQNVILQQISFLPPKCELSNQTYFQVVQCYSFVLHFSSSSPSRSLRQHTWHSVSLLYPHYNPVKEGDWPTFTKQISSLSGNVNLTLPSPTSILFAALFGKILNYFPNIKFQECYLLLIQSNAIPILVSIRLKSLDLDLKVNWTVSASLKALQS